MQGPPVGPLRTQLVTADLGVMPEERCERAGGYCAERSSRMAAGGNKTAHTWARLDALQLGALVMRPQAEWAREPSAGELALMRQLRAATEKRVREATDPSRLGTALTYVEGFAAAFPSRPLFMRRGGMDDAEAAAFNAETATMLKQYIRRRGSIRPGHIGEVLMADTISGYVGTFIEAVNVLTHGKLVVPEYDTRQRKQMKTMLHEDGPKAAGDRTKHLGFRGRHWKLAAENSSFDRTSRRGRFRWTTAYAQYQCLMRNGEPGKGKGTQPFDPARGITLADVRQWTPAMTQNGRWAVVLMIVASKDQKKRNMRRPCPIAARGDGPAPTDDPLCGYSLVMQLFLERKAQVCTVPGFCTAPQCCAACKAAPLFVWPGSGEVWTTADGRAVADDLCRAAGEDPAEHLGSTMRIGGASDICELCGEERGAVVVTRRGRWSTDISHIYRRNTATEQLDASTDMVDVRGLEMEALLPGWTQPTRNWGHGR